ncbi:hypothetical protein ACMATS_06145 [Streptoverticillium reticulum]|uniref:hypothetical protein n=1 Tax=Streptoverticillium reticulum TaxID=1433415 RepID=UPI0039BEE537
MRITGQRPKAVVPAPRTAVENSAAPQGPVTVWTDADYHLTEATRRALADSVPEETRRHYERWWDAAGAFCRVNGRVALPMTPQTLAEFTHELTKTISDRTGKLLGGSSLDQAIAAVRAVHTIAGYDGQPVTREARRLIRAHKKHLSTVEGRTVKRSAIVTPEQAADVVEHIEQEMRAAMTQARAGGGDIVRAALPHLRDRFLVIGSFLGWTRRSETSAVSIPDVTETAVGLEFLIRSSKTDQEGEGATVHVRRRDDVLDPVTAWCEYRDALAACGITTGRVLRRVDRWGNVGDGLSGESINDITQRLTEAAGCAYDAKGRKVTSHGWRASGNSAAKRAGASGESRREHGRWAPDSTMPDDVYDRDSVTDPMSAVCLQ